jgi:hypothetical protein
VSKLYAAIQRARLHQEHARMVDVALREAESAGTSPRIDPRGAPADERRLRGIPVIGGVGGHIPGTRPDQRNVRLRDVGFDD